MCVLSHNCLLLSAVGFFALPFFNYLFVRSQANAVLKLAGLLRGLLVRLRCLVRYVLHSGAVCRGAGAVGFCTYFSCAPNRSSVFCSSCYLRWA